MNQEFNKLNFFFISKIKKKNILNNEIKNISIIIKNIKSTINPNLMTQAM